MSRKATPIRLVPTLHFCCMLLNHWSKPSDPLLPTRAGGFEQLNAFPELIAADKTKYIEELDKLPKYEVIFLRPRRWGKTTFLDTLANYYDKSQKARFNHLFRDFYIGMHPTPDRSSLLVLRFDFSSISGATDDLGTQFHNNIHSTLKSFLKTNQEFLRPVDPAMLNPADGAASLREVLVCHVDSYADLRSSEVV